MSYDLAILGGGPSAIAAGVYAARKRLKTVFITKDFESQSAISSDIQNWIGTISITGIEYVAMLRKHLIAYTSDEFYLVEGQWVTKLEKSKNGFAITTDKGQFEAKSVLVATGSHRRKLEIPGAKEYENKGITYCASCDGPLFADTDVAVIGGGNAAFDSAAQLLAYCKSVTLIQRGEEFRADEVTVQKVLEHPNFKAVKNNELLEIKGGKFVSSLTYLDKNTGKKVDLPVNGIFVEIGSLPNTEFLKGVVTLDATNHIVTDPKNQKTSVEGIWAAGDVTDGLYHQNNIAAGDGVKALEDLYLWIHAK